MSYQHLAVEKFWSDFYALTPQQKESVRRAWLIFKRDPFHPSLRSHEIRELSAKAKHTIYIGHNSDSVKLAVRMVSRLSILIALCICFFLPCGHRQKRRCFATNEDERDKSAQ